jgi:hypothetical protein
MSRDRESHNRWKRNYRDRRKPRPDLVNPPGGRDPGERSFAFSTSGADYVPTRPNKWSGHDAALSWESPSAQFLGDPPIGRRAIDARR